MRTTSWLKISAVSLAVTAVMLSTVQTGLAGPNPVRRPGGERVYDPRTGALIFIGTEPGGAIASSLANPSAASLTQNATAFIGNISAEIGLANPSTDLALAHASKSPNGHATTRYHQVYQGIQVFGSDVII